MMTVRTIDILTSRAKFCHICCCCSNPIGPLSGESHPLEVDWCPRAPLKEPGEL